MTDYSSEVAPTVGIVGFPDMGPPMARGVQHAVVTGVEAQRRAAAAAGGGQ